MGGTGPASEPRPVSVPTKAVASVLYVLAGSAIAFALVSVITTVVVTSPKTEDIGFLLALVASSLALGAAFLVVGRALRRKRRWAHRSALAMFTFAVAGQIACVLVLVASSSQGDERDFLILGLLLSAALCCVPACVLLTEKCRSDFRTPVTTSRSEA